MRKDYQSKQEVKKNLKRYLITLLCCIPLLFVVGFLLGESVNRALRIFIFMLIIGAVIIVEEMIVAKRNAKKVDKKPKQDVFK